MARQCYTDRGVFYREGKWLTVLYIVLPAVAILVALIVPAIRRWLGP